MSTFSLDHLNERRASSTQIERMYGQVIRQGRVTLTHLIYLSVEPGTVRQRRSARTNVTAEAATARARQTASTVAFTSLFTITPIFISGTIDYRHSIVLH